ncbi:MAG: type II CRISPR RNA-guided endonuclease Cas9, partial [Coprobacillaceae bacterium]
MRKIVLGLDIGVASVGWSIIDKNTGEIIDLGSRLFDSASASENVTRRDARGSRRLTRRKKHRRERIRKLLEENGFYLDNSYINENPYVIRVKGLREKLTKSEIFVALYHLAKRRGISYLDDVIEEKDIKMDSLKINAKELATKYPSEIQLERFEKYGQIRGIVETTDSDNKNYLVNIFPTSEYQKEAKAILQKQSEFYSQIDQKFINTYIEILTNKRSYFIGPGNEKSRTDYGVYRINGDKWDNLFEILIGKCSIYPDELRAAKASFTAQEFNILNDLNNLKISILEGEKLSTLQKKEIIEIVKQSNTVNMLSIISKHIGCQKEDISGYRINKNKKPEFHTLEIYRRINKVLKERDISKTFTREEYDELAHILTINSETLEIKKRIQEKFPNIEESIISIFIDLNKKGVFSSWHSLSLKAMNQMIPELYSTSKNQMQIVHEWGVTKNKNKDYKDLKYIPEEVILENIYNPIASRSIRQSIKIVNALIKKYGDNELDSIVIEMPREYISSEDEKKELEKFQKKNQQEKKEAIIEAKKEYLFDDEAFHNHKYLDLKIRLWYQQKQKCIYSGKTIKIKDL